MVEISYYTTLFRSLSSTKFPPFRITKFSGKSWQNSHNRINSFVPPGLINSSTSHSMTLCTTKSSVTCGKTYAYSRTHPSVTAYGEYAQSNTNLSKFHITHRDSSTSHISTSYRPHIPTNDVPTYVLVSTHIIPFSPHLRHSKFLASNSLTFNPACEKCEILS